MNKNQANTNGAVAGCTLKASTKGSLWVEPGSRVDFGHLASLLGHLVSAFGTEWPNTLVFDMAGSECGSVNARRMQSLLSCWADAIGAACKFIRPTRKTGWQAVLYREPR